ncbi:phosphate regulon sensor histidine kinase PhoR [Fulvimonas soli]|jgi:two-component system phosphate regulon sensor histidine kinase PhoR|uniref:Phosphate regulon sensor protein PhoR n=1 Tax=Fulvimonas soli TaxID=155197 RepID=A0A316IHZ3_9GAMM|nr:phosphate regulon sensor histidine kinase PhoR [Fulvimonas soli]PWK92779.1 two-component system phosphate regulon sensor histidine kinase PhoR [Fulvimonas soli]TNY28055.1 phosphate regulon sensor histidine kinase PhoR [Fulvimonas soli]
MTPPPARWKLPLALAAALAAGGLAGAWLGHAALGVAVVAVAEVVALLSRNGHPARSIMPGQAPSPLQHDRFMTRSRRLASSLRDLRSAAGSLPDAVVLMDDDQRVRWFNHAAERLLGLRRPQDRGVRLHERLLGTALAAWLQDGAREPLNDIPAPGRPDGHLNATLLAFGRGQRLLIARDISDLARLEQVRRDFVANVSHELRTPLTVIHGYLELLDPEDVPELAPVLGEMRTQSKRMGQIVEDLLTLSRLETQERITEERVPMAPLLATLRKEAEALSQGRHRISVESTAAADLLGSPKELHSALSNLVSNAVRYTPTGGEISIRWRREPGGAVYSVADTGYGIPAAHLARLTERFYRVSSSRSRESGGTGLGLSIVKHVLNLHQARLTIDSAPGRGSTFACHFGSERLLEPGNGEEI